MGTVAASYWQQRQDVSLLSRRDAQAAAACAARGGCASPKTMKRSPGHYEEWIQACQGGPKPISNFDYAGPLTETMLLGILAMRRQGTDSNGTRKRLKVKNLPELNRFVQGEYRSGWTL